MTMMAHYRWPV